MRHGHFREQAGGSGKKLRTRAALVDAAIKVVAEKGMEALKITDVTTAADVANGTFYNHFEDKDEILREAAFAIVVEVSQKLDADMAGIEDGPTRVVTATAQFIEIVVDAPDWAAVVLGGTDHVPQLREDADTYLRADLERGVAQGKFDVEVTSLLVDQILALIAVAMRTQLKGGRDTKVTSQVCESILRLLGVSGAKARKVVSSVLND
ncbi:MAG: TetR/AcrR family transcriptional regulator [Parvibaculum sp.]|nr:TetR/AcrR family transcriptional regulator [Parvibaculum sp.]